MSHKAELIEKILDALSREWDLHGNSPNVRLIHLLKQHLPASSEDEARLSIQSYLRWLETEAARPTTPTRPTILKDGRFVQVTVPVDGSDRNFNVYLKKNGKFGIHQVKPEPESQSGFGRLLSPRMLSLRSHPSIKHAPGWGLRRFAQLCFSKRTYSNVLEPVLSDLQTEYFEALAERDLWRAQISRVRNYGAFWLAVVAQLPVSLVKVLVNLWKSKIV